jgi:hypothetical protein
MSDDRLMYKAALAIAAAIRSSVCHYLAEVWPGEEAGAFLIRVTGDLSGPFACYPARFDLGLRIDRRAGCGDSGAWSHAVRSSSGWENRCSGPSAGVRGACRVEAVGPEGVYLGKIGCFHPPPVRGSLTVRLAFPAFRPGSGPWRRRPQSRAGSEATVWPGIASPSTTSFTLAARFLHWSV